MLKVKVKEVVESNPNIIPSVKKFGKTAVLVDHKGEEYKKSLTSEEYQEFKAKVQVYKDKVIEGKAERTLSRYLAPLRKIMSVVTTKKKVDKENLEVATKKVIKKAKKINRETSPLFKALKEVDTKNMSLEDENELLKLAEKINASRNKSTTSVKVVPGE